VVLRPKFFALDDAATMVQLNTVQVIKATDPKQNKVAIDAVYQKFAPQYIMIMGAIDIIPHQDLINPAYSGDGQDDDDDHRAYGDLPYACEEAYDKDIHTFLGPTRVVGRLPDITKGTDVQYLLNLLETAANYKDRKAELYYPYFGIAARTFKEATLVSLSKIFSHNKDLKTVPPHDQVWPPELLSRLSHFINCHGSSDDSQFYGESDDDMPPSMDAKNLARQISEGTIVAAECCFGGQLFDPAKNEERGQMGIANTYLVNKAYGFFGSTTLAYGTEESNDSADLICRYFLQKVFQGASLGRAALEARQSFIQNVEMDDPTNRKTIAQFNLYGDPSVHPVIPPSGLIQVPAVPEVTGGTKPSGPKKLRRGKGPSPILERIQRRRDLFTRGLALLKSQPTISEIVGNLKELVHEALKKVAADQGLIPEKILSFKVKAPDIWQSMPKELFSKDLFCDHIHMIFGTAEKILEEAPKALGIKPKRVPKVVRALIARELGGNIVSVKKVVSR
jgi:hypothetical protein